MLEQLQCKPTHWLKPNENFTMKAEYLLTLLKTPKIGRKTAEIVLANCIGSPGNTVELLDYFQEARKQKSIPIPTLEDLNTAHEKAVKALDKCAEHDVAVLSVTDQRYPDRYRHMPDRPLLVYAKGNVSALNPQHAVAIIGTREPSAFGNKAGYRLAQLFAEQGFTVVSGLATGCDTIAHRACLDAGGQTVAVLASGVDYIYPKENRGLAQEILEANGCLISEYELGVRPLPVFFVDRDRLQSGLSDAVIVIETDIKGGTMHTVKFSQLQNRYLACLSHPAQYRDHNKAQGNNMLISDKKAFPLGSSEEINRFKNLLMHGQYQDSTETSQGSLEPLSPATTANFIAQQDPQNEAGKEHEYRPVPGTQFRMF